MQQWEDDRTKPALVRLWDGNYQLAGEVAGELGGGFKFVENDAGTAHLRMPLDHHLTQWVTNFRGRAKRDVHVTFDKQGARWSGHMDHYAVKRDKTGASYLEITFIHDIAQLKSIRVWPNPFLPAEFQFPKAWALFGPTKWALMLSLLVNLVRLENRVWMLPDDPGDLHFWGDLDTSRWAIVCKPFPFLEDHSNTAFVYSRFKSWYDLAKPKLDDAQLTLDVRRWLEGDPLPWDGAKVRHGALVVDIVDNSGWKQQTSFFGNLLTGLERAFVSIGDDGMTEGINLIEGDASYPNEYYEPGWRGTRPEAPWVIFEESPYTGIESSEFTYYPAGPTQWIVGGHSAPGVNEGISAAVIGIGGFIGSLFGQAQIGPAIDAVAKPLYSDVVAAFQVHRDGSRENQFGDFHPKEGWADGADRAYTLAALVALRAYKFKTRERVACTLKVSDAVPYRVGTNGQGDMWIGTRVGVSVLGQPAHEVYVEQISGLEWEWDANGPSGWRIEVGSREPSDPMMNAFNMLRDLASGFQELGVA
ncbi:phage tail protein [Rhodococcus hoagii]|nr:phage tail protein [Prescottella equi]